MVILRHYFFYALFFFVYYRVQEAAAQRQSREAEGLLSTVLCPVSTVFVLFTPGLALTKIKFWFSFPSVVQ
jgi:hypothetical protein